VSQLPQGARRLAPPFLFILGALVLSQMIVPDPEMLEMVPGPVGPAGWPRAMIAGIVLCSAIWAAREIWLMRQGNRVVAEEPPADGETGNGLALLGVGIVVLYGIAIPWIGFALATVLFIAGWCLLGGIRRPVLVAAVSVLGCLVLLYTFVMIASMPLSRGVGVFDTATVTLYTMLGIY